MDLATDHAEVVEIRQTVRREVVAVATAAGRLELQIEPELRATLADQAHELADAVVHQLGWTREATPQLDAEAGPLARVLQQRLQLLLHPAFVGELGRAHVELEH